jgi:uncharacterized protein YndB with AHSA1/START domain
LRSELDAAPREDLEASPERVFGACVDVDELARWWGPAGFTTLAVEIDARKGGRYRITMQPPSGDAFHLRGAFRAVDPPHHLAYTFEWEEPDVDDQETLVTLTFAEAANGGTRLVLDQGQFRTEARYELHRDGWIETLARLEDALAG